MVTKLVVNLLLITFLIVSVCGLGYLKDAFKKPQLDKVIPNFIKKLEDYGASQNSDNNKKSDNKNSDADEKPSSPSFSNILKFPSMPNILNYPKTSTNAPKSYNCDEHTKFRTIDGSCNNLKHPDWGKSGTCLERLLPPNYKDDKQVPAANVSRYCYPDAPFNYCNLTLSFMQFGQLIAHDFSLRSEGNGQCTGDYNSKDTYSTSNSQKDDYSKDSDLKFKYGKDNSKDKKSEQISTVTHYLDLSVVYGSSEVQNNAIRLYKCGLLKYDVRKNKKWLPKENNSAVACPFQDADCPCYKAGDVRVNLEPQLTILHTLFHLEHNRIADELCKLNPHWSDETVYQHARKINIAQYQFIVYYEWLILLCGKQNAYANCLIYDSERYVEDYDENVSAATINEFTTAAFRCLHTMIAGKLSLVDDNREVKGSCSLDEAYFRPGLLEKDNTFHDLCIGLHTQCSMAPDVYHVSEITQTLFKQKGKLFGDDLKKIDIERGREHRLPSYNDCRVKCGLKRAKTFDDFCNEISPENIKKLENLYEYPDKVELTVGGSFEIPAEGTVVGPTFLCIIMKQFYKSRVGDRFFFENGNCFTFDQLKNIRNTSSIARIVCENSCGDIKSMQRKGFKTISSSNPLESCHKLPNLDLTLWKEGNSKHQNVKNNFTQKDENSSLDHGYNNGQDKDNTGQNNEHNNGQNDKDKLEQNEKGNSKNNETNSEKRGTDNYGQNDKSHSDQNKEHTAGQKDMYNSG